MSLTLRIGRWYFTLFDMGIDDQEKDDDQQPFMSTTSNLDIAPGFVSNEGYWEEEE
jgi:hypothetical protein